MLSIYVENNPSGSTMSLKAEMFLLKIGYIKMKNVKVRDFPSFCRNGFLSISLSEGCNNSGLASW